MQIPFLGLEQLPITRLIFFFLIQYYTGLIVVAFEQNHNVSRASPNHLPLAGR